MKTRDPAEYPSLRSFGVSCLYVVALCTLLLSICASITFTASANTVAGKTAVIISAVLIFSGVLAIRSLTIAYQCKRGKIQTFDRQCPEWMTVALLLVLTVTILWPE